MSLPDTSMVEFMNAPPRPAQGLRVGVLFVRAAFEDELGVDARSHAAHKTGGQWIVEHALGGLCVTPDFGEALMMADEIMRFSDIPLESVTTTHELWQAVDQFDEWMACRDHPLPSYRDWLARKGHDHGY